MRTYSKWAVNSTVRDNSMSMRIAGYVPWLVLLFGIAFTGLVFYVAPSPGSVVDTAAKYLVSIITAAVVVACVWCSRVSVIFDRDSNSLRAGNQRVSSLSNIAHILIVKDTSDKSTTYTIKFDFVDPEDVVLPRNFGPFQSLMNRTEARDLATEIAEFLGVPIIETDKASLNMRSPTDWTFR